MKGGVAGGSPRHEVVDVQQRVQRRAQRLDLALVEIVLELPTAAVHGRRQHLRRVQQRCSLVRRVKLNSKQILNEIGLPCGVVHSSESTRGTFSLV